MNKSRTHVHVYAKTVILPYPFLPTKIQTGGEVPQTAVCSQYMLEFPEISYPSSQLKYTVVLYTVEFVDTNPLSGIEKFPQSGK